MATAVSATGSGVGPLLRAWRKRRRRTQLDLALDAGISARHLSFVETGRSKPSAEMVLRLAEQLEIPFRERNLLLMAAGHAPAFPERALDDPELATVRATIDLILERHEPYPAVAFDSRWNLVANNHGMTRLAVDVDPALLEPPVNLLRVGLHPRGMARRVISLGHWRTRLLERVREQVATSSDPALRELLEELTQYPLPPDADPRDPPGPALGPIRYRAPEGGEWAFFAVFATFDSPFDVTSSELAIELLFAADPATEAAFAGSAGPR